MTAVSPAWPNYRDPDWDVTLKNYIDSSARSAAASTIGLLQYKAGNLVTIADSFKRDNGALGRADTGQTYFVGNSSGVTIANGVADFSNTQANVATICNLPSVSAKSVSAEFVFNAGTRPFAGLTAATPNYYDAVIGASATGFANGSIQLLVTPSNWALFCVGHPIVDPYPNLVSGTFDTPLSEDGVTRYRAAIHYRGGNTVSLELPGNSSAVVYGVDNTGASATGTWWGDGGTCTVSDIGTYWPGAGKGLVSFQCRRTTVPTCGHVNFTAFACADATLASKYAYALPAPVIQANKAGQANIPLAAISAIDSANIATGQSYRYHVGGKISADSSDCTFALDIGVQKLGADTVPPVVPLNFGNGFTAGPALFDLWLDVTVGTVGTTAPFQVTGTVTVESPTGLTSTPVNASLTHDTTAGMTFRVLSNISVASAGCSIELDVCTITQIV